MRYLVNEALLRLVKPAMVLVLAAILYLVLVGPVGEPGSVSLALLCWLSASAFVLLAETGII